MKRTIKNPHWTNNARTVLSVEFHYDDGRVSTAVINSNDSNNADYQEVRAKFSADELEQNTQKMIKKQSQELEAKRAAEEAKIDKERQERLFAVKLQAFEVDAIKNTANKTLKSSLRRAKTDFEVFAYAAAIILDSIQNPPEETQDTPSE